jgi:putative transposase
VDASQSRPPPPRETIVSSLPSGDDGGRENLNHHPVMLDRDRVGPEASPSAAVIDSQSVKTAEAGRRRGCNAGKKINGRMRHAMDGRSSVGPGLPRV